MAQVDIKSDKEIIILEATLALISERGFHNTPMSLIAKRSGVSAGIIYHYFDNKDALINELYKDIKRRKTEAMTQGDIEQLEWQDAIEQLWLNSYHFYVSHPNETRFLEQYENSPYFKTWDEAQFAASAGDAMMILMARIQQLMHDGIIRQMPLIVLNELTFGVALNIAKRQISGIVNLDDATLATIAHACRRAIESE